jgi:glycosyltransferase involved in cell wall biosynthesis
LTRVHQALSGVGPYDAVSTQAQAWRKLLAGWGMEGEIYADSIDPRAGDGVHALSELVRDPGDLIVIRYSAYAPTLRPMLDLPQPKLLVYHNVTPPRYFWNHHPAVAVACALGRDQLPRYAQSVDVAAADSRFNERELELAGALQTRVVPILFETGRLDERGPAPEGDGPLVLVVGRLVPNKRHDLAIAAFADYQRRYAPQARLVLVGEPLSPAYRLLIERLARQSGARSVSVTGGLPQRQLNSLYASADVLLSTSEHEGFCVPLLEAFHFGVPVVARRAGAMPEVGGDAVLWADEGDAEMLAELLDLAVGDTTLRHELARRGQRRLEGFAYERTAERIRGAVEAALGSTRTPG